MFSKFLLFVGLFYLWLVGSCLRFLLIWSDFYIARTVLYYLFTYKMFWWSCCRFRIILPFWNYAHKWHNYTTIVIEEKYNGCMKCYFAIDLHIWVLPFSHLVVIWFFFSSILQINIALLYVQLILFENCALCTTIFASKSGKW